MRFTCLTLFGLGAMLPSVFGATQNVMVGMNGQLVFSPSNLTAAVGDTVNFLFMSPGKNHVCLFVPINCQSLIIFVSKVCYAKRFCDAM